MHQTGKPVTIKLLWSYVMIFQVYTTASFRCCLFWGFSLQFPSKHKPWHYSAWPMILSILIISRSFISTHFSTHFSRSYSWFQNFCGFSLYLLIFFANSNLGSWFLLLKSSLHCVVWPLYFCPKSGPWIFTPAMWSLLVISLTVSFGFSSQLSQYFLPSTVIFSPLGNLLTLLVYYQE